jgi:hypothetical protein
LIVSWKNRALGCGPDSFGSVQEPADASCDNGREQRFPQTKTDFLLAYKEGFYMMRASLDGRKLSELFPGQRLARSALKNNGSQLFSI